MQVWDFGKKGKAQQRTPSWPLNCQACLLLAAFAPELELMSLMMLYLFHVCSVTPESPRGQCCCQILVSTEARAQPASRPGPFHRSLSAAFTPISYSLTSGHHFCSTWRKSAIQDFWLDFFVFLFCFFWALQHSAVCFNVFLPSELWESKEKPFSEVSWATSKPLHAHRSGAGARERCLPHFLTAKTSHASERQPPTPHRLH